MLQRAASNAYSWWWASHIRTKQSKWLEQNLQDMEEKVQIVLKMIDQDGDSFAKRAEMYYKRRPELISFVEESFKAYRALAERYDKLSTDLQNANNTIATVFPDQVQFSMDDEDDDGPPRAPKSFPPFSATNVPSVPPNFPTTDIKGLLTSTSKSLQARQTVRGSNADKKTPPKSGLTEPEALDEIDKLQKEILAEQTVKEFVKSSYEGGIARYWEIENHIMEMQDRVFNLEEEFNVGRVIEDDEARKLMAGAALKSCEGTLAQLEERQERSNVEAQEEGLRVEDAKKKLDSLKNKLLPEVEQEEEENVVNEIGTNEAEKPEPVQEKNAVEAEEPSKDSISVGTDEPTQKPEAVQEKNAVKAKEPSKDSISVTELAQKIDDLVSKVIGLEAAVSSQTALIERLRKETNDLHEQIRALEGDKASLIKDANVLTQNLKEMHDKLKGCQNLNQNVENQNIRIRTHFIEARCSLDHISGRLHNVRPYEECEYTCSIPEEEESSPGNMTPVAESGRREVSSGGEGQNGKVLQETVKKNNNSEEKADEKVYGRQSSSDKPDDLILADKVEDFDAPRLANGKQQDEVTEEDDEPSWQEMLLNGLEDREQILLEEYNAVLRNYKDVKKQLADVEKKNRDNIFETSVQLREMRGAIARKDKEIQLLRQKLNLLQRNKSWKESVSPNSSTSLDDQDVSVGLNEEAKVNGGDLEEKHPTGNKELEEEKPEGDMEDARSTSMDEPHSASLIEERLRMNIDALLDENLDFWLRFGSSFHQIQKFKTRFDDLKGEIAKLRRKANKDVNGKKDIRSEVRPIYKHLREIQTELTVWIGRSALLKDELHRRFSSLCGIQEDITTALKEGAEEEEMKFTSHEGAKFQGEILNMKQENNKVRNELQSGLDHVTTLRKEIETTLEAINDEFGLSRKSSRVRIPLRSFLFEAKPKKKSSIFSFIQHMKYHQSKSSQIPM